MKYVLTGLVVVVLLAVGWFLNRNTIEVVEVTPATKEASTTEVQTERDVVIEEEVEYFPGAKGFYVEPAEAGVYPGVVMIHENRGLRPEIKAEATELAREGYRVLAVDLYNGTVMETQEEARAFSQQYNQVEGLENLTTAVQYLRDRGAEKVASLGWCFGGRQSIELSISGVPLDATVVYYGGGMATSTERLSAIRWPVLGVFGDQDQVLPVSMVNDFESSLNALGIENEIYMYEGVGHAFANPSNPNFAPEATADAWEKTLAFLARHLAPVE
jgi:carboxymethylenebutenolidase